MTGTKLLQYLGLRRAPATGRTAADRTWTVVMVVAVTVTLFLTRSLDFWSQIVVLVAVSVVLGVLGGAALITIAARRSRRDASE